MGRVRCHALTGMANPAQPLILFQRFERGEAKRHLLLDKARQNQRAVGPGDAIEVGMNRIEHERADIGNYEVRHRVAHRIRTSHEYRNRRVLLCGGHRIGMNIAAKHLAYTQVHRGLRQNSGAATYIEHGNRVLNISP